MNTQDKQMSSNQTPDTPELIFADYDCNNITVFEAMDRVEQLIREKQTEARKDQIMRDEQAFTLNYETDESLMIRIREDLVAELEGVEE